MEFPGDLDFFKNEDLETAVPRSSCETVRELMAQIRPNGSVTGHFPVALGGSSLREINQILSTIILSPVLNNYKLKYQFSARNTAIWRNLTNSEWLDVDSIIAANSTTIMDLSDKEVPQRWF
jgi:hypothetical protein